jgi:hypothetical protein
MKSCEACGLTESQASADARTLGLLEEFRGGVYTCCQIAMWANEQWLAWFQAIHADNSGHALAEFALPEEQEEQVLVPVRLRRRVPWYRQG